MKKHALIFALLSFAACDDSRHHPGGNGPTDPNADMTAPCAGLQCLVVDCKEQPTTSISGTVYAPNGKLPLYNVAVFVPNSDLEPLTTGATCDRCGAPLSGNPIVKTLSDEHGHFQLDGVPAGSDIPLVVQLGKWRRMVTIPQVLSCQDNPLTDPNLTRLPKNRSEGDMPKIAVTLGGCDQISCMLPKVGIDPIEFGNASQDRAVTFFSTPSASGITGATSATTALWNDASKMAKYDMLILSCECQEATNTGFQDSKNATSFKAMADYLAMGGRIFTTDFQYTWYKYSPDPQLKSIATIPGGAPVTPGPILLDDTFPKGKALADWMKFTNLSPMYGKVPADEIFDNFSSTDSSKVQTWATEGAHPRFMTINTPAGQPVEMQCGKATHLDAHINSSDTIDASFPAGCSSPLGSAEGAFAFFFFDLASCIQDDSMTPIL